MTTRSRNGGNRWVLKQASKGVGMILFFLYSCAFLFYTFLITPASLTIPYSLIPFECAEGYETHCPRIVVVNFLYYNLILVLFSCLVAFKKPRRGGLLLLLHCAIFLSLQTYLSIWNGAGLFFNEYPFVFIFWKSLFAAADFPLLISGMLFFLSTKGEKIQKINIKEQIAQAFKWGLYYAYGLFIVMLSSNIIDCAFKIHYFYWNSCDFTLTDFFWYTPLILIFLQKYVILKTKNSPLNRKII